MPAVPPKVGNDAPSTLPAELASEMDEIQQQVSEIRGLQPDKPIIRALLTQDELQEKVENEFFKDYTAEDAQEDALILSTLGLLPKDFDLIGLYKQLYAEQIAGYYDSETKEMYVVQGDEFAGIERMTYAHEFTHILQDQAYDLENGLKINDDYCEIETEYCSAVTALVEGDATYTEQDWMLSNANSQDRQDIQNFYGTYSSPVFDSAPMYLQKDFLFPYQYGLEFVYSLTDRGGYDLVNQTYKNPPVTTEQILHPDKYPAGKRERDKSARSGEHPSRQMGKGGRKCTWRMVYLPGSRLRPRNRLTGFRRIQPANRLPVGGATATRFMLIHQTGKLFSS